MGTWIHTAAVPEDHQHLHPALIPQRNPSNLANSSYKTVLGQGKPCPFASSRFWSSTNYLRTPSCKISVTSSYGNTVPNLASRGPFAVDIQYQTLSQGSTLEQPRAQMPRPCTGGPKANIRKRPLLALTSGAGPPARSGPRSALQWRSPS